MPDDNGSRDRREAVKTGVEIRVEPGEAAAQQTAAEALSETIRSAVATAGCASIAISGGRTPRGMHRLLARPPYAAAISRDRAHLFWADERRVGYEHPASNFGAARMDFLQSLPRPPDCLLRSFLGLKISPFSGKRIRNIQPVHTIQPGALACRHYRNFKNWDNPFGSILSAAR